MLGSGIYSLATVDLDALVGDMNLEKLHRIFQSVMKRQFEKNSDEEAGTVISQDPKAGSKISKGQEVDIIVSKGPKTKKVSVPSVTGATLENAQNALSSRGLHVGSVTKQQSSQTAGTVISQSVAGGSEVEAGTTVDLVIAEPASQTKTQEKTKTSEKQEPPKKNETTKTK